MALGPNHGKTAILEKAAKLENIIDAEIDRVAMAKGIGEIIFVTITEKDLDPNGAVEKILRERYIAAGWGDLKFQGKTPKPGEDWQGDFRLYRTPQG
jgi:hypothetical protein